MILWFLSQLSNLQLSPKANTIHCQMMGVPLSHMILSREVGRKKEKVKLVIMQLNITVMYTWSASL